MVLALMADERVPVLLALVLPREPLPVLLVLNN